MIEVFDENIGKNMKSPLDMREASEMRKRKAPKKEVDKEPRLMIMTKFVSFVIYGSSTQIQLMIIPRKTHGKNGILPHLHPPRDNSQRVRNYTKYLFGMKTDEIDPTDELKVDDIEK